MDEKPITREEHNEFRKRLEEANNRQNARIEALEENMNKIVLQQMGSLTTSIEKLILKVDNMTKEHEQQSKRLEIIEGRDGEMWRKVTGYIITAVIGIVVGFVFTRIGM